MGQIIIDLPNRITRRYRLDNKALAEAILASLEAEALPVENHSALSKEDVSDIRAARAARAEFLKTGEGYTVEALRVEFNL